MHKNKIQSYWLTTLLIGAFIGIGLIVAMQTIKKPVIEAQSGFAKTLAPVLPYTVSIYTNQTVDLAKSSLNDDPIFSQYVRPGSYQKTSLGSGIILDTEGHIVTNAHVVQNAQQVIVVANNGVQAEVTQTYIDPETDIAVLKTGLKISNPLPVANAGSIQVGDLAFTIGNPFGIGQSVSMGIISATARTQPNLTNLTDFIQTDASINPGNSGGALVNANGEVIGMNTAIYSSSGGSQGIGFAIPFEHVQKVAHDLLQDGMVSRGYLGIDVRELTNREVLESNIDQDSALTVISVAPNSPAESAGIRQGDIIVSLDNAPLTNRSQAARLIAQLVPEKTSTLEIWRNGKKMAVPVTIGYRQ